MTTHTFKCSRCDWTGMRADAKASIEVLPVEDGLEQIPGIMCPDCTSPLDFATPLPDPEIIAGKFVDILRQWAAEASVTSRHGNDIWAKMLADNTAETDPHICHSHDWCDANMAMDEAFRALSIDHEERWGEDWASAEAAGALWNTAWGIARCDHLSGRQITTKDSHQI